MNVLRFLWGASKRTVLLAVIVGVLSGATSAGTVAVINAVLNKGTSPGMTLVWSFVGLGTVMLVSSVLSGVLLVYLGQGTIYELRMRLSRQILATPLRKLEELGSHRLLASLTDDVTTVTQAVTLSPLLFVDLAIVVGCFVFMGWLSWQAVLMTLGFAVLGNITYQLPTNAANRYLKQARESEDQLYDHFQALTRGTKELKLHRGRQEAFLSEVLGQTAQAFRRYNVIGMMIYTAAGFWGQALFLVLIGLLIFLVPLLLTMSQATITGYTLAILYMITPFASILNMVPSFVRAIIALDKVERLGLALANPAPAATEVSALQDGAWRRLKFRGITHAYHRERENDLFTLGPVDLEFGPGELVFMVGGNGSGKTTLAKLMTGLYAPEGGEIWLDDCQVTDANRDQYCQLFSTVFSDFYLFESLLGLKGADADTRVAGYLARLQLDHKVSVENGVLSTTALSTGQRKRLALLTAYLEDRPLYLFDEWASDQDPVFKEVFYTQLLPELKQKGKTVFVITHDDKFYHLADRVVKLDYGKVEYDRLLGDSEEVARAGETLAGAN
ncbi:MAG TPA: cyclic peptide export ABC transporter [Symbiobacteriaceae bacterium]|nr:cyclic peptide export ABC transporter [Symbiobacteriaceae bacterium]